MPENAAIVRRGYEAFNRAPARSSGGRPSLTVSAATRPRRAARSGPTWSEARDGRFKIVENLGAIDPNEALVGTPVLTRW